MRRTIIGRGFLGAPVEATCNMLAACLSFRTVVAAANQANAQQFIFAPLADDTMDENGNLANPRPRAIIEPPLRAQSLQKGTQFWGNSGNLYLSLEFIPSPAVRGNVADEMLEFCNRVGMIVDELRELSGQDDPLTGLTYLNITGIVLISGPFRCEPQNENQELFYGVTFELDWE